MEEIWVDVKGFEGIYQISNHGRLKSFKKNREGYILQMHNRFGDYFSVVLQSKGTKGRSVRIHQLVAAAFIPNPNGLPEVNHKDGNKQNNRVDNLEWVTRKENHQHMMKMYPNACDAMITYNKNRARNIEQYTLDGEFVARYTSYKEASEKTGVCYRNIYQVASKTPFNERGAVRKQAGGFIWRYANEYRREEVQ